MAGQERDSIDPPIDEDLERGNELLDLGAESLSGVAGAAIGSALGPEAALAGAAAGPALTRLVRWAGGEVRNRLLSSREELRIGGALHIAVQLIEERTASGEKPRSDGVFEPGADPRGLLEGTLLTAARSYEEEKVLHIGAFYAALVFDEEVSADTAHFLLHVLDRLTYRQLCALAYFATDDREGERAAIQLDAAENGSRTAEGVVAELGELANFGLIGFAQEDGRVTNPLAAWGAGRIDAGAATDTGTTELGGDLVRLANLEMISPQRLDEFAASFRG